MVSDEYFLAHCISCDAEMGKGIAVDFRSAFGLYVTRTAGKQGLLSIGDCFKEGRVLSLVTKQLYYEKPTYDTMEFALYALLTVCLKNNIRLLAMPKIGCGLDRLSWYKVKDLIYTTFDGFDIEILVCKK